MYLDTDIILALIKEEDWLKQIVSRLNLKGAKTSTFTVIESRIVLEREYSRNDANEALKKINNLKIEILSVDRKIIEKSQELIDKYNRLGIFDSIHVACAVVYNESLISTDNAFDEIKEIKLINPRLID